jgi:hypothetical protein
MPFNRISSIQGFLNEVSSNPRHVQLAKLTSLQSATNPALRVMYVPRSKDEVLSKS